MTTLVYLDTETTGLDPRIHEVWEASWAVGDDPVVTTVYLNHELRTADPKALELNGYWSRMPFGRLGAAPELDLRTALTGATIVGANPAFDTAFLSNRWRIAPWHHRLIDVESMALTVLGYERPKGLHALSADLRERGHEIPQADHSAAADVAATRAVYNALRAEATA